MMNDLLPASGTPSSVWPLSSSEEGWEGLANLLAQGREIYWAKEAVLPRVGLEEKSGGPGWCLWPSGRPNFPPGVYFALCLSLMVLSLLETIFISYLLHLATTQPPPMPRWLHFLLLHCTSPRTCCPAVPQKENMGLDHLPGEESALPRLPLPSPLLFCSYLLPNPPGDLGGPQLSLCLTVDVKEPMEFVGKVPSPRES